MDNAVSEFVDYKLVDGVATMLMDDGKANAFSVGMTTALSAGLDRAKDEAEVVVIQGKPGLFCAGFDLKVINGPKEGILEMVTAGAELALKTYMHPQPVIIGCTGHAMAAGALFLCAADYRIGILGEFKIGLNETSIGLSLPTWGLELVRDRLDNRMLNRATLSSELFTPEQAAAVGYLDEAVDFDEFSVRLGEKASEFRKLGRPAYGVVKQRLRMARETLIRSGMADELAARSDSGV